MATIAGACALAILAGTPAPAQDTGDDVQKEIEALKKGQQEIQKQLEEIKKMLAARPAAPAAPAGPAIEGKSINLGSNPMRGENTAALTLIEFSDYQ